MKLTKILPLIPTIALLASCSQPQIKLGQDKNQMVSEKQTEAPTNFVTYPDDRPSIPDGKAVYERTLDGQSCVTCHGATGEGGSGPALNDKRLMSTIKPVDMYLMLTYGKEGSQHKALKDKLSNKEIWNLVFYAKSLGTPPLTTADMDVIMPVFGSNCAVCHGTKGDGDGPLARNLEPNPANFQTMKRFFDRTDDVLYDHIANGIKFEGMPNFLGKEDRKKNFKFDHDNIHKLVMYVRNFHVSNEGNAIAEAPAPAAAPAAPKKEETSVPAEAGKPGQSAAPAQSESKPAAESKPEAAKGETAPAPEATSSGAEKKGDTAAESKNAEKKD